MVSHDFLLVIYETRKKKRWRNRKGRKRKAKGSQCKGREGGERQDSWERMSAEVLQPAVEIRQSGDYIWRVNIKGNSQNQETGERERRGGGRR